ARGAGDAHANSRTDLRISRYSEPAASEAAANVPPLVYETLQSGGQGLHADTRGSMEPFFNRNFADVQVHTDNKAAESALAVNALAYTVGRHVVFGAGQYAPTTAAGRRLLAHELTHVVQQSGGGGDALQRQPQEPGVCDSSNLGTLGKPGMYMKPEA